MQGTVTSLFIVGAFFGCLASAVINGRWGRKTIAHAGSLVLTLGAVLQSSSYGVAQLLVGRIVAGVGLGVGPFHPKGKEHRLTKTAHCLEHHNVAV